MNHISFKTKTSKRTIMCGTGAWSILGDVYNAIRTQSFNPESKKKE